MNKTQIDPRCWIEIDLATLRRNWEIISGMCSDDCAPIAVMKANCYGLGAARIAQELEGIGCRFFSTADMSEALELREAGIKSPILLLGPISPGIVRIAIEQNIIVPTVDVQHAGALNDEACRAGGTLRTHIKIDVGLSRLGIPILGREAEAAREVEEILRMKDLSNEGMMTHISGMMDPKYDYLNVEQLERFRSFCYRIKASDRGIKTHCESSLLFLSHPDHHMSYVRLTSAIVGIQRGYDVRGVRQIASLKTRVMQIKHIPKGTSVGYWMTYVAPRDMRLGIVGVGYGDGLIRSLTTGAEMSVRGAKAKVVGKLSMSFAAIDLTDIPDVALGDEVTVFGARDEDPSVWEYADLYGGHPCEVVSMLKESIPKVYI